MKFKSNKAITLIALVIIVIILLILAGVFITMVLGENGLINKVQKAVEVQKIETLKEALELEKAEIVMEGKKVNLENYLAQIEQGGKSYTLNRTEKIDDNNLEIIADDKYKFLIKDDGTGNVEIIYEGVITELGEISITATAYTGDYDEQAHNVLTAISTEPNNTRIEYSLNGVNYSTTMPSITEAGTYTIYIRAIKLGYNVKETTTTAIINKANGTLNLSETNGTITYLESGSFTVGNNTGTLSVTSSNTSIATASINENTVTITAKGVGTAIITVKSAEATNYKEQTATYTVTVQYKTYSVGSSVTVSGYNFYVIGDSGDKVTLLSKTNYGGDTNWSGARARASTFGSSLGGTGRLMTVSEANGVAASYRYTGQWYWLADLIVSNGAYYVLSNGSITADSYGNSEKNTCGVRPVVEISKSKIS